MTNQKTNSVKGSAKKNPQNGGLDKTKSGQTANYETTLFNQRDGSIVVSIEITSKLEKNRKSITQYVHERQAKADSLDIYGWSRGKYISSSTYDDLINSDLKIKKLNLRGRGIWNTCRCPKQSSSIGEQYDDIEEKDITNLEYIHITSTFEISSCALLDLVSRSPKLKILRFFGHLSLTDHFEPFRTRRFLCDMERVYWPYCSRKHKQTLTTLVKRNENISTFYTKGSITFDLLGADALPGLRYLSILLNDNWNCKGGLKRVYEYLSRTSHLSNAKNLEGLEIRTYDLKLEEDCDRNTSQKIERLFENYKVTLFEQISRLPKLKYLAIYGSWELEKICGAIAKHAIQVELLKVNLMPTSVLTAIDAEDDSPVLSMADGIRNLKKLPKLRSFHYLCHEKLGGIDNKTVMAFKELLDLFWNLDIKTCFTSDVEELITYIIRRGNQVGKTYKILLHIEPKNPEYAYCIVESVLKFTSGTSLRSKLAAIAENASLERFGKPAYQNFQVWGLEQISNTRDTVMYQQLQSSWSKYDDIFELGFNFAADDAYELNA